MNEATPLLATTILAKYKDFSPETVDIPTNEAAPVAGVSPRTLEKWRAKRKNLSFTRSPGGITYNLKEILDYKESLKIKAVEVV